MMLLAAFTLLIVFGMPYLMDNSMSSLCPPYLSANRQPLSPVDPEMRAEFEKSQKKTGSSGANPLQNFDAAAWLAGKPSDGSSAGGGAGGKKTEEKGVTR